VRLTCEGEREISMGCRREARVKSEGKIEGEESPKKE
jgi:hypothetical protein